MQKISCTDKDLKKLFNDIPDRNRFLLSYRDRLFSHFNSIERGRIPFGSPFEEDKLHYFSIVTEGVNRLCFFGVKIDVLSDCIKPYHENGRYKDVTREEVIFVLLIGNSMRIIR